MNFIGIDISLNSTAICIESVKGSFILSFTNKKDNNIYIKELDRSGVKFFHSNRVVSKDYSENEILKIKHYIEQSDRMISEIRELIDEREQTFCQIEGYSFSKNTSSILDIVGLSTLIRSKLIDNIKGIDIKIISPSTLKLETCKMVYPPVNVGIKKEKLEYRNNKGLAGGSFKKPDMFMAMLDGNIDSIISGFLNDYKELVERSKIPNPIEDIIDSIFCCKILINDKKSII